MTARWIDNPHDHGYEKDEILMTEDGVAIARLEGFGYACYPCAINAKTGQLERGGAHQDRGRAKLWAERVAGLRPTLPGDERPAFYYTERYLFGIRERFFVCFFHFVGWSCLSIGVHVDTASPNVEVHVPFGFFRIGWMGVHRPRKRPTFGRSWKDRDR